MTVLHMFIFTNPHCTVSSTDVNRKCWCFTTKGMHAVGQSEIVILLQCLPDEKCLPKDIFNHFVQLYRDALAGERTAYLKIVMTADS